MEKAQELDLEMKLLRGKKVLFERLTIQPLTLEQIEEMGIITYLNGIGFLSLTKEKVIGRQLKEVFKDYSYYDIIVNYDELREQFLNFIRLFVCHDEDEGSVRYEPKIDSVVIKYNKVLGKINSSNFENFLELMRFVYHVTITERESERADIDDEMADLLKEFEEVEDKINKDKGNEITFTSMIEAVCVKHPSLNLMNIWNYTMYQFLKTYNRIEQIDNSNNIMKAIYSGAVETKKIDLKSYHWAKKLP